MCLGGAGGTSDPSMTSAERAYTAGISTLEKEADQQMAVFGYCDVATLAGVCWQGHAAGMRPVRDWSHLDVPAAITRGPGFGTGEEVT